MPKTTTWLWFEGNAEDAARFYTSVFPNSRILQTTYYTEVGPGTPGSVLTVTFTLDGREYGALNGGPEFKFSEAISIMVHCKDQKEVDYYWDKLLEGGEPSVCGWLKDKYGLSWQIVPVALYEMLEDKDRLKANRVMETMLKMVKIDLAELQRAYAGK